MAAFTVRGVAFERVDGDEVQMTLTDYAGDSYRFSPEDWASIIAHVSYLGGTPEQFHAARELHRSAITGKFVSAEEAAANPATTVTEHND